MSSANPFSPRRTIGLLTLLLCAPPAEAQRAIVPFDSPSRLTFPPSGFRQPDPAAHAVDLGEGLVVYVATDATTPTVSLTALVGASRLDDPPGKEGLAEALAFAMTNAGPADLPATTFLDRLAAMDARLVADVDNEHTRVSLSLLNEDLDEGLRLFASLLRAPRLDAATLEACRRRGPVRGWNPDDPRARPEFEFPRLIYGDHPAGRGPTRESLAAITLDDLRAFHRQFVVPSNIVLAASGGLSREDTVRALRQALFATPWTRTTVTRAVLPPVSTAEGRKVHVFDTNTLQGWMIVGHLGRQGRVADHAALEVANYILGGGGAIWKRVHAERPPATAEGHFRARLFAESREMRGLSNDTSSYVPAGFRVAAPAYAVTLGRPESIAFLLKIIDTEWRRIATDVSDEDLDIAKHALVEGAFQMRFSGAHATALSLAEERFFDGNHTWSRTYEGAIRDVTRAQVLAAAQKYFKADQLVAVLVGPLEAIRRAEHPQFKARLEDFGEVVVHPW